LSIHAGVINGLKLGVRETHLSQNNAKMQKCKDAILDSQLRGRLTQFDPQIRGAVFSVLVRGTPALNLRVCYQDCNCYTALY
jgi:hypothetical protein